MSYGVPEPYSPPDWAKGLAVIPKSRVKLAQLPTPIHQWTVPDLPDGFELYIKRDDLTGAALSGNKVRKLEFIFAEAIEQGCDTVITGGSLQSNHARATAMVARELGMDSSLILFNNKGSEAIRPIGNLLMDRLVGSSIGTMQIGITDNTFDLYSEIFAKECDRIKSQSKTPYVAELGGANAIGCWGYIEGFREMIEQGVLDNFDDIIVSMGAGGTVCGLAVANYLTGSKLKIHGISIGMPCVSLSKHMDEEIAEVGLTDDDGQPITIHSLVDDMSDNIDPGYSHVTMEQLKLLTDISTQTGVVLDTTFTLKTFQGMISKMKEKPDQFKGHRVLFLHTGGLFGLSGLDDVLPTIPATNQIHSIQDFITI